MAWHEMQRKLRGALEAGLMQEFEPPLGKLMADAITYNARIWLEQKELKRFVDSDSAAALTAILNNAVTGSTMNLIRSTMIGSALLNDTDAVMRWAKEGATRCKRVGGEWMDTEPLWGWIVQNPQRYIEHVREIKVFLNQIE